MPNTNQYHLTIDVNGISESPVANTKQTSDNEFGNFTKAFKKETKKLVSYAFIVGTAQKIVSNEVGLMQSKTGAVQYEEKMQAVRKFTNPLLSSVGVGIATGNVWMALFALGAGAVQFGVETWQNQRKINIDNAVESVGQSFQARRIGVNGRRS